jgi:hypothetical protein
MSGSAENGAAAGDPDPIECLLIERACERLVTEYAKRIDARDERFVDLFTVDARLALLGFEMNGQDEIREFARKYRPDDNTLHLTTHIAIDVIDADMARGSAVLVYFCAPRKDGRAALATVAPLVTANYADEFRRTPEGWRIARRTVTPTIMTEPVTQS